MEFNAYLRANSVRFCKLYGRFRFTAYSDNKRWAWKIIFGKTIIDVILNKQYSVYRYFQCCDCLMSDCILCNADVAILCHNKELNYVIKLLNKLNAF